MTCVHIEKIKKKNPETETYLYNIFRRYDELSTYSEVVKCVNWLRLTPPLINISKENYVPLLVNFVRR